MATIKLQNGKVVFKNGKPSCECCDEEEEEFEGIGCSVVDGPVSYPVSRATALLIKQGGLWTINVDVSFAASYSQTIAPPADQVHLYSTGVVANQSKTVSSTNKCTHGFNPVWDNVGDSGSFTLISNVNPDGNSSTQYTTAELEASASVTVREPSSNSGSFSVNFTGSVRIFATASTLSGGLTPSVGFNTVNFAGFNRQFSLTANLEQSTSAFFGGQPITDFAASATASIDVTLSSLAP